MRTQRFCLGCGESFTRGDPETPVACNTPIPDVCGDCREDPAARRSLAAVQALAEGVFGVTEGSRDWPGNTERPLL